MSWEDEIRELANRKTLAFRMGGADKVARQHQFNKLTIRERVAAISDAGTFDEVGTLAGVGRYDEAGTLESFTPSNFVFGVAEIDGRPVVLSGDAFPVRGGSADASIAGKRTRAEGLALELRLPHIRLVDGMGGGGSVKTRETAGRTYIPELRGWETVVQHLAVAPSVWIPKSWWRERVSGRRKGVWIRPGAKVGTPFQVKDSLERSGPQGNLRFRAVSSVTIA